MPKIFRKGRFQFFKGKGFGQYLLYVLLEMLLVIAGILIALSINNASEKNKEELKVIAILEEVERDLRLNLEEMDKLLLVFEKRDSLMQRVLSQEVTWEDYQKNPEYAGLIIRYSNFKFKDNGHQNMVRYANFFGRKYDTLIPKLEDLYKNEFGGMTDMNERVSDLVINTIETWSEKFPWLRLLGTAQLPQEAKDYFLTDPFYLNKVFTYRTYNSNNLMTMMRATRMSLMEVQAMIAGFLYPDRDPYSNIGGELIGLNKKMWLQDTGTYDLQGLVQIKLQLKGSELFMQVPSTPALRLYPIADSMLYLPALHGKFTINRDKGSLTLKTKGPSQVFLKVTKN
jgi:hypothetical protein